MQIQQVDGKVEDHKGFATWNPKTIDGQCTHAYTISFLIPINMEQRYTKNQQWQQIRNLDSHPQTVNLPESL